MPKLDLAAGIGLDGDVALNQDAGKVRAFCTSLADTAGSTFAQRASLAHLAFQPLLAMAALAGHF